MSKCIVTTTLHDPNVDMVPMIEKYGKIAKEKCGPLIIVVSDKTSPITIEKLKEVSDVVEMCNSPKNKDTYIIALQIALEKADESDNILYVDYDRLLHWVSSYPEEFPDIPFSKPEADLFHIGRTPKAYETHPETQKKTEILANELGSTILKFDKTRDLLSACWRFSKSLTQKILDLNLNTDKGFYVYWPLMAYKWAKNPWYQEVNGQEWETPDRFREQIQKMGYDNWIKEFQTTKEWERRNELLTDCIRELFQIF